MNDDYITISGIRYDATGIAGYYFFKNGERIFTISDDLSMQSCRKHHMVWKERNLFCTDDDDDATFILGLRRHIMEANGKCYGFYFFGGSSFSAHGHFVSGEILDEFLDITESENGWEFEYYKSGDWPPKFEERIVAQIIRLPEDKRTKVVNECNSFDLEKRFTVKILKELDERWYPLILSVPVIGF